MLVSNHTFNCFVEHICKSKALQNCLVCLYKVKKNVQKITFQEISKIPLGHIHFAPIAHSHGKHAKFLLNLNKERDHRAVLPSYRLA